MTAGKACFWFLRMYGTVRENSWTYWLCLDGGVDSSIATVRVNRKGANRAASGHPWIFASDVISHGSAQPGDVVRVVDPKGRNIGVAHFSSASQIALRLLTTRFEPIDAQFLRRRIETAYRHRQKVVDNSDAYRLVHAEGDLLPGLVVDRYGNWLALQLLDQGMDRMKDSIATVLLGLLNPKGIVARNDTASRAKEGLPQDVTVLCGEVPESVEIRMNGLALAADLLKGQKTGVFLDQRENYLAVRRYARGRALDCFTGSGGFALHVANVCESVEAVDSSATALGALKSNCKRNGIDNVSVVQADVLEYLPAQVNARCNFDIVIVDPPAFTKSRGAVEGAARGYKEINLRALKLLHTGGILVSCSCSHHMTEAHLLQLIASAALDCGKTLRVLERRTQAQDHPILLTVPETHYLKCLILEVL
jgi:23S rRNA (cytosine1962-C5)-methyltransferase